MEAHSEGPVNTLTPIKTTLNGRFVFVDIKTVIILDLGFALDLASSS